MSKLTLTSRLLVPAAAVVAVLATTAAAGSQLEGRIVFRGYLDAAKTTGAISTIAPNGTKRVQLTHPPRRTIDTEPDWSADGTRIAFERQVPCPAGGPRDGLNNTCDLVYTMTSEGTGVKQLVPCGFDASAAFPGNCVGVDHPGWSPDGSKLAFQYNLVDSRYADSLNLNAGIWIVDADGSDAHQITQRTPGRFWDFGPQWSPDGSTLAFWRRDLKADREAIYTVGANGTGESRVTPASLNAANPNWSRDGRWILFSAEANGSENVYKIHPDGSGLANVTKEPASGFHYLSASFAPSGRTIVTARTPGTGPEGAADLVVMNADGSKAHPITRMRLWESGADWGRASSR